MTAATTPAVASVKADAKTSIAAALRKQAEGEMVGLLNTLHAQQASVEAATKAVEDTRKAIEAREVKLTADLAAFEVL